MPDETREKFRTVSDKLTKGELLDVARQDYGVAADDDLSYEELRALVDIFQCKQCGDEHVGRYEEDFCSDGCEVAYINEHHS